jgi:hypothetical protein
MLVLFGANRTEGFVRRAIELATGITIFGAVNVDVQVISVCFKLESAAS